MRSKAWWETRRLFDDPARRQGGPKNLALLELDGEPAGYAIYNVKQDWVSGFSKGAVDDRSRSSTPTPEAARELWRWLLDFDWTSEFVADLLPLDHQLFLLLAEPRRMQFKINDGVWVRLIDIGQALSARTLQRRRDRARRRRRVHAGERGPLARHAAGRGAHGRRSRSAARRHRSRLGVPRRLHVRRRWCAASRAQELTDGAAARADALFRTDVEPWCAEIF